VSRLVRDTLRSTSTLATSFTTDLCTGRAPCARRRRSLSLLDRPVVKLAACNHYFCQCVPPSPHSRAHLRTGGWRTRGITPQGCH
jgi:hypothetical protein